MTSRCYPWSNYLVRDRPRAPCPTANTGSAGSFRFDCRGSGHESFHSFSRHLALRPRLILLPLVATTLTAKPRPRFARPPAPTGRQQPSAATGPRSTNIFLPQRAQRTLSNSGGKLRIPSPHCSATSASSAVNPPFTELEKLDEVRFARHRSRPRPRRR